MSWRAHCWKALALPHPPEGGAFGEAVPDLHSSPGLNADGQTRWAMGNEALSRLAG